MREAAPFLGLAFYWVWVAMVFYGHALIPATSLTHADLADNFVDAVWLWATWAHMLGLVAIALFRRRLLPFFRKGASRLVGAIVMAAGTVLIPIESTALGLENPLCQPLALATAIPLGLGSAWLVLQWAESYGSALQPSLVAVTTSLSFALGLMGYFILLAFPATLGAIMTALMPLLSLLALMETHKVPCEGPREDSAGKFRAAASSFPTASPLSRTSLAALLVAVASVFVFALCGEMLRAFALTLAGASVSNMGMQYLVGGLIGLALLSASMLAPSGRRQRATPKHPPAPSTASTEAEARASDAGAPFSRQLTAPFLRTVFLLMAGAFLAAPFLAPSALAVSYGIFGVGFWCFRAITWAVCFPLCRRHGISPVLAIGVLDATYASSVVIGSTLNRWLTEALKVGATEMATVSLIAVFALMFMALFVLNGPTARAILAPDEACAEDATSTMGVNESPHATPLASRPDSTPQANEEDLDAIAHAIRNLADARGLTPREVEVATLLAKGRSLPFVQDELYISAGTAQTHARHIYKKLAIHSRQELIDLAERTACEISVASSTPSQG